MKVSLIVAAARNGAIGKDNKLLWRLKADMKRFRKLTMGKPILMGRKTYQSIGRPLDGRDNIIISGQRDFAVEGGYVVPTLEAGLVLAAEKCAARSVDEVMIIGGAAVYQAALPLADRLYFSLVEAEPEGDVFFPLPAPTDWRLISSEAFEKDADNDYVHHYQVYERV